MGAAAAAARAVLLPSRKGDASTSAPPLYSSPDNEGVRREVAAAFDVEEEGCPRREGEASPGTSELLRRRVCRVIAAAAAAAAPSTGDGAGREPLNAAAAA